MARTVRGRKGPAKKAASRKAAPKAKAKAAVKKKAAPKAKARAKAAVKKAAPRKAAARAPAKKSVARVPAARRAPPRRPRAAVVPRRKVAAPRLKAAAQRFAVSHLNEADFVRDGLRAYALYRDLGIAAASGGMCQAHVIRLLSPCTDEVRKQHRHEAELQLIYVLKGWIKNEFDGEGVQMMSAGSCWLQPPGIKHTVLDYSADVELLEIIVPADFKTVDVD
jgi:uncharacterized RmlC-like cupin family protein